MNYSSDLHAFWGEHAAWSQATFGSDLERGPAGPLKHLAKETVEAAVQPYDVSEFADLVLLTFDSTRRAGFSYDQLVAAVWAKLAICKMRKWSKASADDPVEHVRE